MPAAFVHIDCEADDHSWQLAANPEPNPDSCQTSAGFAVSGETPDGFQTRLLCHCHLPKVIRTPDTSSIVLLLAGSAHQLALRIQDDKAALRSLRYAAQRGYGVFQEDVIHDRIRAHRRQLAQLACDQTLPHFAAQFQAAE